MIKSMLIKCDMCPRETFTDGSKDAPGWKSIRWQPGVITPPTGWTPPRAGRYDLCSPACVMAFERLCYPEKKGPI